MLELAGEDVEGEAVAFESESALRVVCVELAVVVVDISWGVVTRSHVIVRVTNEPVLDAMEV